MMYLMIVVAACGMVFSIAEFVGARREEKKGMKIVWLVLAIAFAVSTVLSVLAVVLE